MKKPRTKRARKTPKTIVVFVHVAGTANDPYDNSIGGPNDYAYGM